MKSKTSSTVFSYYYFDNNAGGYYWNRYAFIARAELYRYRHLIYASPLATKLLRPVDADRQEPPPDRIQRQLVDFT